MPTRGLSNKAASTHTTPFNHSSFYTQEAFQTKQLLQTENLSIKAAFTHNKPFKQLLQIKNLSNKAAFDTPQTFQTKPPAWSKGYKRSRYSKHGFINVSSKKTMKKHKIQRPYLRDLAKNPNPLIKVSKTMIFGQTPNPLFKVRTLIKDFRRLWGAVGTSFSGQISATGLS
jgi:hypothetical protein